MQLLIFHNQANVCVSSYSSYHNYTIGNIPECNEDPATVKFQSQV